MTTGNEQPTTDNQSRFDRGAWLTLAFALFLLLTSAAQLAYRFTLPTDGWGVISEDLSDKSHWIYIGNLVGAPSDLRRDDVLLTVEGRSVLASDESDISVPPHWKAGATVIMGVRRDETDLERLTAEMLGVVDGTMLPEFVGLWLKEPGADK